MINTPANPKKFRLSPGDAFGFSDDSERVAVTWPRSTSSSEPEESLLAALEDAGVKFPDRELAADIISEQFETQCDKRAAETLVMLFSRLPGGRRGDELRAAFLGMMDGESLSETSARHGVCKVTWFKSIKRLRRRLFGKTANAPDYF